MQRLNVRQTQIRECIERSLFAVDRFPNFKAGEILLLQLVKEEARKLERLNSRIEFSLIYSHYEIDHSGEISRRHWPKAGKIWRYILFCSETIPTIPFSLESLPLTNQYGGQTNPIAINQEDEKYILPFIWGKKTGYEIRDLFGPGLVRETLVNYDVIAHHQQPHKIIIPEHEEYYRSPLLAESLKAVYDHRCQICGMNFRIKYDEPFSETHHIEPLAEGGFDTAGNIVVVCPNHHRIIHKTKPNFNRSRLLYKYPNGLEERFVLADHLEHSSFWK